MRRLPRRALVFLLPVIVLAGSCFAEPGPTPQRGGRGGAGATESGGKGGRTEIGGTDVVGGGGEGGMDVPSCVPMRELDERARCRTVDSGEPLLGRIPDAAATERSVFTFDLFRLMERTCGTCHVAAALGDPPFQVSADNVSDVVDSEVLSIITSDDPNIVMPPPPPYGNGRPFGERADGDPVRQLADWIRVWLEQGAPSDLFTLPADLAGESRYVYDEDFAGRLTNIGSCVPDRGLVATEGEMSCELDARFATLEKSTEPDATDPEWVGLPATLDQTDLFTLDSEELAKHGVISFAPTYPLWSDGAGKMRHVRVPLGQSIRFDRRTQEFEIPPNARFYKTFFKKIIDHDGSERMKKMETRLIVSRPDRRREDGSYEVTALFGTYIWNDQETRADLLTDWQRDQKPFTSRIIRYVSDEPGAKEVLDNLRPGRDRDLALRDARVVRHYAVPGRQACVECHMGSRSQSFVLGFTPLQLRFRPEGEGGAIHPVGDDELGQLERLIEYGVITGIDSPDEVELLEDSQGDRHARSPEELVAQGYLFGNCAHCHNPRGFASVSAPELRALLDFWPRRDGGIFEFPLDRMSPRIKRGKQATVSLPYITPSLRDMWPASQADPWIAKTAGETSDGSIDFADAPWRSVIYRNVDTPFIYFDDWAIFPHMPRNTAGYDCRAPRILGDWMVSIPALRYEPALNENGVHPNFPGATSTFDNAAQPYREVRPEEPDYPDAVAAAGDRLAAYRSGERYGYCVDQADILDRDVLELRRPTPEDREILSAPLDGVPDRVHWVFVDETEPPGAWFPRRPDWKATLVDQQIPTVPTPTSPTDSGWARKIQRDAEAELVGLLQNVTLQSIREFALTEFPMGRWLEKEECDYPSLRNVSALPEPRPRWAQTLRGEAANVPLYEVLPGEAVFSMICVNCHGPNADSKGAIAGTLSQMTGGLARVANFRTGLFGHGVDGALNRDIVFGEVIREESLSISAEDLAARYLPWMALGGTKVAISPMILNMVANTEVLGAGRSGGIGTTNLSANMLTVAQELCQGVLGRPNKRFSMLDSPRAINWSLIYETSGLILENGDAELWEALCNWENPSPVRVIQAVDWTQESVRLDVQTFYKRSGYPASARVGNQEAGIEQGIQPTNRFPWCIQEPPADPAAAHDAAVRYVTEHGIDGQPLPFCPAELLTAANKLERNLDVGPNFRDDMRAWTARGAINAGLAVFLFLQEYIVNRRSPTPRYDHCEELGN